MAMSSRRPPFRCGSPQLSHHGYRPVLVCPRPAAELASPVSPQGPAVLSPELAADLDDYLSFRHVLRNIHGFELRSERVMYLSPADSPR